ncbi:MAG: PadR family transcriptional regulator [Actinomycetota bacterium]|nr:PadR family transcriptional regulator [Actinomycetota bacterium]
MPERITRQLLAVLEAMMADPGREWYGLELMDATRLSSGTLYPILHRLVSDGWLTRTRDAASTVGGSGRRLYRLTSVGELAAAEALERRRTRRPAVPATRRPGIQPA